MQSFAIRIYHYQNSCFVQLVFETDHLAHLASQVFAAFGITQGVVNNNTFTAVISDDQIRNYGALLYLNSAIQYLQEVIIGIRDPFPPAPLQIPQPVQNNNNTPALMDSSDSSDSDESNFPFSSPFDWDSLNDDIF